MHTRTISNFSNLAAICLILSGCGGQESSRETNQIEPEADEAGRLGQLGIAVSKRGLPSWDAQYKALRDKLMELLAEDYQEMSKVETFERMLKICRGEIRELADPEVRAGAGAYLAEFDDPEVVYFLFEVSKSGDPIGIPRYAIRGISRLCTGEVMDRVIGLLDGDKDDWHVAHSILTRIRTKKQLREFEQKLPRVKNKAHREAAASVILSLRRANLK